MQREKGKKKERQAERERETAKRDLLALLQIPAMAKAGSDWSHEPKT